MDKVRVIEGSLTCYALGWLSLIPVLGLVAAFVGLVEARSVIALSEGQWNPARKYLVAGRLLSGLGLLINGMPILLLLAFLLANAML
jgi:hypothetical protein